MFSSSLSRQVFSTSCRSRQRHSKLLSTSVSSIVDRSRERESRNRRCLSTYYDSQSGLHLPIHDETEIRLFLDVRDGHKQNDNNENELPFVPHQLNKDRVEADWTEEKLQRLVQQGIHGVILPAIKFPRDIRNLQTLSVIAPRGFVFLSDNSSETSDSNSIDDGLLKAQKLSSSANNFSKVLRFQNEEGFRDILQRSIDKGLNTTLALTEDVYAGGENDVEPITLANNIAAMIDASGGCDYIWISSEQQKKENTTVGETMVQVCEELVYLDVAGATIKSRLLVDSLNEDMLEDIMFAGINKYVIDNENQAEMVEITAKEQGKALFRL